jgi:hypothetical protein
MAGFDVGTEIFGHRGTSGTHLGSSLSERSESGIKTRRKRKSFTHSVGSSVGASVHFLTLVVDCRRSAATFSS